MYQLPDGSLVPAPPSAANQAAGPGGQAYGQAAGVQHYGQAPAYGQVRAGHLLRGLGLAKLANFGKILQIFGGLVLGCIKTKFCKKICV